MLCGCYNCDTVQTCVQRNISAMRISWSLTPHNPNATLRYVTSPAPTYTYTRTIAQNEIGMINIGHTRYIKPTRALHRHRIRLSSLHNNKIPHATPLAVSGKRCPPKNNGRSSMAHRLMGPKLSMNETETALRRNVDIEASCSERERERERDKYEIHLHHAMPGEKIMRHRVGSPRATPSRQTPSRRDRQTWAGGRGTPTATADATRWWCWCRCLCSACRGCPRAWQRFHYTRRNERTNEQLGGDMQDNTDIIEISGFVSWNKWSRDAHSDDRYSTQCRGQLSQQTKRDRQIEWYR